MRGLIFGGLAAGTLVLAGGAVAGEPVRLTDGQLDRISAGAFTGADIFAQAALGSGSTFALAYNHGAGAGIDYGFDATTYALNVLAQEDGAVTQLGAHAGSVDAGGQAEALIQGQVTTTTTPFSSISVGVFQAQTAAAGNAVASVGANGAASGGYTKTRTLFAPADNSGVSTIYTFAYAFDLPVFSAAPVNR